MMAIKLTPESFLNVVKQSGLIETDKLKIAISEIKDSGVNTNESREIANALVDRKELTRWQADKLLQGKHKGFFLGKYRLLSLLGKGGMSSVYLAEHVLMRRRCAIKVLPSKRVHDSSYLARFHREAQAVAALDHQNIVRAYDVDKENEKEAEIHFLVMEYVEGRSFQEVVVQDGPVDFIPAADFIRQGADGLEHAHQAGMVHRDIKPGNLLVDNSNVVKLLDLGLARFFDNDDEEALTLRHDEKVLGTADYLAPEQALDSHSVDLRADLYSLGCTFYFLLTGHAPYTEGTLTQRLMAHQTQEPPPVQNDRPDVPAALVAILKKMMAKSVDDRFQTSNEVSEALAAWLIENAGESWKLQNPSLIGAGSGSGIGVPIAPPTAETPAASSATKSAEDANLADFLSNLDAKPTKPTAKKPTEAPAEILSETPSTPEISPIPVAAEPAISSIPSKEISTSSTVVQTHHPSLQPEGQSGQDDILAASNDDNLADFLLNMEPGQDSAVQEKQQPQAALPAVAIPTAEPVASTPPPAAVGVPVAQAVHPQVKPTEPPTFPAAPADNQTAAEAVPVAQPIDFNQSVSEPAPVSAIPVATPVDSSLVAEAVPPAPLVGQAVPSEAPLFPSPGTPTTPPIATAAPVLNTAAPASTESYTSYSRKKKSSGKSPLGKLIVGNKLLADKKKVTILAVGLLLAMSTVFGVYSMSDNAEPSPAPAPKKKQTATANTGTSNSNRDFPSEIAVGANEKYKTIKAALDAVRNRFQPENPNEKQIVRLTAGTYPERIVIDNSGFSSKLPRGVQLIAEKGANVILAPTGPEPAVSLNSVEGFTIQGLHIKASGKDVAIDIAGYLLSTSLKELTISGFKKTGLNIQGVSGLSSEKVNLTNLKFTDATPTAVGINIEAGFAGTSEIIISGCQFLGSMNAGIQLASDCSQLSIRQAIFHGQKNGILLAGANRQLQDVTFSNNTFHQVDRGIVFSEIPNNQSSGVGFYRNLFVDVKTAEFIVEKKFNQQAFSELLNSSDGKGSENNWSSRAAASTKPNEFDLFANAGKRGQAIKFASTDPANAKFLAPAAGSSFRSVGSPRKGRQKQIGAVAP